MEKIKSINGEELAEIDLIEIISELEREHNYIVSKNERQLYIIGYCRGLKKMADLVKKNNELSEDEKEIIKESKTPWEDN